MKHLYNSPVVGSYIRSLRDRQRVGRILDYAPDIGVRVQFGNGMRHTIYWLDYLVNYEPTEPQFLVCARKKKPTLEQIYKSDRAVYAWAIESWKRSLQHQENTP